MKYKISLGIQANAEQSQSIESALTIHARSSVRGPLVINGDAKQKNTCEMVTTYLHHYGRALVAAQAAKEN